jgi:hypothetical protein
LALRHQRAARPTPRLHRRRGLDASLNTFPRAANQRPNPSAPPPADFGSGRRDAAGAGSISSRGIGRLGHGIRPGTVCSRSIALRTTQEQPGCDPKHKGMKFCTASLRCGIIEIDD